MTRSKLSKILEIIAWSVALVVLLGGILYFNVFKTYELKESYSVGDYAPIFEIELYQSKGSNSGTYSNENEKKILILNFWYTSCGPCKAELPYFNEIQKEYGDDVKIIAIHSYETDTNVDKQKFLDEKGYGAYEIAFGQDTKELYLFNRFGGKSSYPMTVIIDRRGIIQYVKMGGITEEVLADQIEKLL